MKRFRLSLGFACTLFVLGVIIFSFIKPKEYKEPKEPVIIEEPQPSSEEIAFYNLKKQSVEKIVKDYFEEAKRKGDFVGAGISIVQGDSIIYANGVGNKKMNDNSTVDGHTAFRLGSLSKGFAGVLSAAIKAEGLIDYNDPVCVYIPNFQLGNSNQRSVTIQHILSHTAGTPYHSYTNLIESGMALSEIADRFKSVNPISAPGKLYSYQNAMFALCGSIVEKVTHTTFNKAIANRFFKPLGMDDASTNHKDFEMHGNIALPHRKTRYSWKPIRVTDKYDNAIAAGGVNASPSDMAKWMRFLLGHNPEVLPAHAVQDAFEPKVEVKGRSKYYQRWDGHQSSYYGLGWRIHKFEDQSTQEQKTMIHHGGSVNDYRNEIALFPEEDLGICVLFNSNTTLAKHVIPDLHRLIKISLESIDAEQKNSAVASLKGQNNSNS